MHFSVLSCFSSLDNININDISEDGIVVHPRPAPLEENSLVVQSSGSLPSLLNELITKYFLMGESGVFEKNIFFK